MPTAPVLTFQAKCLNLLNILRAGRDPRTILQLAWVLGRCSPRTIYRMLAALEAQGCRFTRETDTRGAVRLQLVHDGLGRPKVTAPTAALLLALYRVSLGLEGRPDPQSPGAFLVEPSERLAEALGLPAASLHRPAPVWCSVEGVPATPAGHLPWALLSTLAEALEGSLAIRFEPAADTTRLVPHRLLFGPEHPVATLLAWNPSLDTWARVPCTREGRARMDGYGHIPTRALRQLEPPRRPGGSARPSL